MRPLFTALCCVIILTTQAQKFTYLINSNQSNKAIVYQNHLWTGTSMGLIKRSFSDGQVIAHLHEGNSNLASNVVRFLAVNKDELWVGTNKGLSIYNESKNSWISPAFSTDQYSAQTEVTDITFDRKGNGWLLSNGSLWKCTNGKTERIFREKIYGTYAFLVSPDDKLWISCNQENQRGIMIYDGKSLSFESHPENVVPAARMFDSKGNFWGAVMNGATRYDGKAWTTHHSGQMQAGNISGFIAEDGGGNIWFDIGRDVCVYKDGKIRFIFEEDKLKGLQAKTLGYFRDIHFLADNNTLIVGRTGVLDYKQKKVFPFPDKLVLNTFEKYVKSFLAPDNKLWIVTQDYILVFNDGVFERLPYESYTLVGNHIKAMQRDVKGRTWITTKEGTSMMDKDRIRHFANYSATPISGDGLVFDKQNRAWGRRFGGDGCFMIDPDGARQQFTKEQDNRFSTVMATLPGIGGNVFSFTTKGVFEYDKGTLTLLPGSPEEYDQISAQCCDDGKNKCWYLIEDRLYEVEHKAWKKIPDKSTDRTQRHIFGYAKIILGNWKK